MYNNNTSGNMKLSEVPIYGTGRLGMDFIDESGNQNPYYQLTDHLGNVRAVVGYDSNGTALAVQSYADYYPFGWKACPSSGVMPGRQMTSGEGYRYGYQGEFAEQESDVDNESASQWNSFELRMYDSRIGRWMTTDPASQFHSPYLAMGNSPTGAVDPDGGTCVGADGKTVVQCPEKYAQFNSAPELYHFYYDTEGSPYAYSWRHGNSTNGYFWKVEYTNGVTSREEHFRKFGVGFQDELGPSADINLRLVGGSGYSYNTKTAYAINAEYSALTADGHLDFAIKPTNYSEFDTGLKFAARGRAIAVETILEGGIVNGQNNKYGLIAEGSLGYFTLDGEIDAGVSIFGIESKATFGGSWASAHIGGDGGVFYDDTDGKLWFVGGHHLGFGVGYKANMAVGIPFRPLFKIMTE